MPEGLLDRARLSRLALVLGRLHDVRGLPRIILAPAQQPSHAHASRMSADAPSPSPAAAERTIQSEMAACVEAGLEAFVTGDKLVVTVERPSGAAVPLTVWVEFRDLRTRGGPTLDKIDDLTRGWDMRGASLKLSEMWRETESPGPVLPAYVEWLVGTTSEDGGHTKERASEEGRVG